MVNHQKITKDELDKKITETYFQSQFESFDNNTLNIDNRLKSESTSCIRVKRDDSDLNQLSGYENLNDNIFYLQPEKKNTYHNYPVLQDNGEFCTQNHQIFRNNTKRNIQIKQENLFKHNVNNIAEIIPDTEPQYLKFSKC